MPKSSFLTVGEAAGSSLGFTFTSLGTSLGSLLPNADRLIVIFRSFALFIGGLTMSAAGNNVALRYWYDRDHDLAFFGWLLLTGIAGAAALD